MKKSKINVSKFEFFFNVNYLNQDRSLFSLGISNFNTLLSTYQLLETFNFFFS